MSDNCGVVKGSLKHLTVRELTKEFQTSVAKLKPGQSVPVTLHGHVIGAYTKARPPGRDPRRVLAKLRPRGDKTNGQRLIEAILRDVA